MTKQLGVGTLYRPVEVCALHKHIVGLWFVVLTKCLEDVDVPLPTVSSEEVPLSHALWRELAKGHSKLFRHFIFGHTHLGIIFLHNFSKLRHICGSLLVNIILNDTLHIELYFVLDVIKLREVHKELSLVEKVSITLCTTLIHL